ncbi:MAG: aldolase/citrate lyase family protein [Candidatus Fimenecus sp.]
MALKLMYLTNDPQIAQIAEKNGVDRIFLDLELRGKEARQGHLDTVISHNSIDDVKRLREAIRSAELLVRVNPVFDGSQEEIDRVIEDGADVVMLPYFKTVAEVNKFVELVGGRAKVCLLCETPEAAENIDEILSVPGIDEVHVGINDLHLGYHRHFMFEMVADGTVDRLCDAFRRHGVSYGFGGVARVGEGMLPAENVLGEHYRLGSQMVILSRAFCDTSKITDFDEISAVFQSGVEAIRRCEKTLSLQDDTYFSENHRIVQQKVQAIVDKIKASKGLN